MTTTETVKVFLLGVAATLLLVMVARESGRPAYAADQTSGGGIIALTAQVGSSGRNIGLFLIDTSSQHVAYYIADDSNNFTLAAARKYGYDLGIDDAPFKNNKGYSLAEAEKLYKQSLKK